MFILISLAIVLGVSGEEDHGSCHPLRVGDIYEGGLSATNQTHCFEFASSMFGDGNNTFQILFDDHHSSVGKYLCSTVEFYSRSGPNGTAVLTNAASMCMDEMEDRDGNASPYCFNVDKATTDYVLINMTCIHHYYGTNKSAENNCDKIPEHISWAIRVLRGCDQVYPRASLTWLIILVWIFVIFILLVLIRHVIRRWRQSRHYVEIPASHTFVPVPDASFVPAGTSAPTNPALRSFMGYTAPPQK